LADECRKCPALLSTFSALPSFANANGSDGARIHVSRFSAWRYTISATDPRLIQLANSTKKARCLCDTGLFELLVCLPARCHWRRGYTGSVFAGCSATPCVNFPVAMKPGRKQDMENILISIVGAPTGVALKMCRSSLCTKLDGSRRKKVHGKFAEIPGKYLIYGNRRHFRENGESG